MPKGEAAARPAGQPHPSSKQLLEAAERLVARLRFDIHDGPLQDTAVLADELSAFDRQLTELVSDESARALLQKRVDALRALVSEIEDDLRELAVSAGARRGNVSLTDALAGEVAHFRRRTGLRADLDIDSDLGRTTPSQRIAVARVVEEALSNVREHALARSVTVSVQRLNGSLDVSIADDGHGFDVDRAVRSAERDHRLGLVAMAERIRLLGGKLEVDSRPGGPTIVQAVLPEMEACDRPHGTVT